MFRSALALALLALAPTVATADGVRPAPARAAQTITVESARRHIEALASDAMMGRNTPSPGLDSAAEYIARELARVGVEPVGGTWFHSFNLKREELDSGNALSIDHRRLELKSDFIPYDFTGVGSVSGDVAFLGYGISLPDSGYDDYAGIDVRGKIVFVIAGEPKRFIPHGYSLRTSPFATARQKMITAAQHGAAAIMILPNPNISRLLRPTGFPWPSLYPSISREAVRLKLDLPDSAATIPALSVGASVARLLIGPTDGIIDIVDAIDSTSTPRSRPLAGRVRITTRIARTLIPSRNVMGVLPGRERPDEYVVLGAHYDHVGTRPPVLLDRSEPEDTIFNGADDNASGTAALLLAARALASLPLDERPSRSILFVAFSAEELGLYGSRAFVATPPVETRQMVAMLNMDMVGRNARDTLSVGGMSRSADMARVLDEANTVEPFAIEDNIEADFYRSDQAPFARVGVPVLFFHSGEHADYHRESDNPDRIDNAKVARVARLIFRAAWILGEMPVRPTAAPVDPNDPKASFIFDR
jgi:aminopeptidase YwaD